MRGRRGKFNRSEKCDIVESFFYLISYYSETMNRVLIKMPFDDNAAFAVEIKRKVLYISIFN